MKLMKIYLIIILIQQPKNPDLIIRTAGEKDYQIFYYGKQLIDCLKRSINSYNIRE